MDTSESFYFEAGKTGSGFEVNYPETVAGSCMA